MRILILLGWRNLLRHKWRTVFTGFMLFFGTFMLVFLTGLAEGTYGAMVKLGTHVFHGDFQVLAEDYHQKPSLFKSVEGYEAIGDALLNQPGVERICYRVEMPGLVSHENLTMGALLVGIDPEREVAGFMDTVSEGAWWQDYGDKLPVVLGKGVAKRLDLHLGSEMTYVGQAADGSIAAELFTVVGITDTGIDEFDRNLGFVPLVVAQELLVMEGKVHRIVGMAEKPERLVGLAALGPYHLLNWQELLPELAQTIKADRQGLYVFLLIIGLVVLLGVANTMLMSVMERTRELGVIGALGTSPPMMSVIVLSEILWLGLFSILPGLFGGALLNKFLSTNGIPTGMDDFDYGGVTMDRMFTTNTFGGTVVIPIIILLCALLAGLLPAIKAAMLRPVDAMRD